VREVLMNTLRQALPSVLLVSILLGLLLFRLQKEQQAPPYTIEERDNQIIITCKE
jgi:uncharacterized protein YehS (DUF1456 family)